MGASYHHGSDRDHCWRNDPVHVSMVVNHMVRPLVVCDLGIDCVTLYHIIEGQTAL